MKLPRLGTVMIGLLGVAGAILFAPRTGAETRQAAADMTGKSLQKMGDALKKFRKGQGAAPAEIIEVKVETQTPVSEAAFPSSEEISFSQ